MSLHKRTCVNLVLVLFAVLVISSTSSVQAQALKAPSSRVDNFREVIHGVEIIDPYRWLEDQDSAETRAWIDAQNKYTHSQLDGLPSRPLIQKRLSELLRVDSVSTPFEQGGRYFLFKKRAEDDLSILYVRQGLNGKDEVLIDPHTLSADHTTDIGRQRFLLQPPTKRHRDPRLLSRDWYRHVEGCRGIRQRLRTRQVG